MVWYDLNPLEYFLGLTITQYLCGSLISQLKYNIDFIFHAHMTYTRWSSSQMMLSHAWPYKPSSQYRETLVSHSLISTLSMLCMWIINCVHCTHCSPRRDSLHSSLSLRTISRALFLLSYSSFKLRQMPIRELIDILLLAILSSLGIPSFL